MLSNWLPLTEYSNKYQVSISTLRRRIKSEDIKFKLFEGRYLILDEPQKHRPSPATSPSLRMASLSQLSNVEVPSDLHLINKKDGHSTTETVLQVANRLLSELKETYAQILREKDEQIVLLKGEQAELKTLVRILEAENQRLSKKQFTL